MLDEVLRLAKEAGEILSPYYGKLRRGDADRKEGARRDLVSRADVESEQYLLSQIPEADDVLGEEGSRRDRGADRMWVIDPLDGTVNFLHGIPFWCVAIALIEEGEPKAAVVHAPELRQTFAAERGKGCTLNGEPVRVSRTTELAESIVATGFAYRRNEYADNNFDNFSAIGLAAAGVRRMGSAAIDMAYTASGRLDGFWELHLYPWDMAAGTLLIREAGGKVTDFRGSEELRKIVFGRNIVATNGHIHEAVCARLSPLKEL
ncbi:MAG: inositol monophosphatase family protein [Planctomycetota bacterium]|jgi:myo-inositol-1(or 4)-monophosphatase